ncbi:MAG: Gfo/Idh/MocA family oxidoreductase [Chloroflexota bacterium]|nr:Gfo/Idh/MocA family oxidoreductase [Chloroflexota bacterium]
MPITPSPIRVGIVGAGLMGRWHAHEVPRAGGRLIAVADIDSPSAERLAHASHALAFVSVDDLFAQIKIDVLHVCTPPETHAELAERALSAGVHVVVEKPLAPDFETTERLLKLAQSTGRLLIPVHQFAFQRGVSSALARLKQIAPLIHLDVTIATAGGEGKDDDARGSLISEILPHPLTLLYRFLPRGLEGVVWNVCRPMPGELRVMGRAERIGLTINLSTRARPTRNLLTVMGERGFVQVDLFHGFAVFENGTVSRAQKILHPIAWSARSFIAANQNLILRAWRNEPAYPGLRELIGAVYRSISVDSPAPIASAEILAVARARDELIVLSRRKTDA